MSVLAQTFQTLARGVPASQVGAALGIDQGLAEACIDHWVRLGMVTTSGSLTMGCTDCLGAAQANTARPPSCFGCPFTRGTTTMAAR